MDFLAFLDHDGHDFPVLDAEEAPGCDGFHR